MVIAIEDSVEMKQLIGLVIICVDNRHHNVGIEFLPSVHNVNTSTSPELEGVLCGSFEGGFPLLAYTTLICAPGAHGRQCRCYQ